MSRPAASEAKCLDAIRAAGSIRSAELAEATGIGINNLGNVLSAAVARGAVVVCRVSGPNGGRPTNEYRIGGGMAAPEFTPLNTKRAGIAGLTPAARRTPDTRAATGVLTERNAAVETPVFLGSTSHQAQVGDALRDRETAPRAINSASTRSDPSMQSTEARAVTAKATPKPAPGARLKREPATVKASAGNAIQCGIDDDGTVLITTPEGFLELDPKQARKLGHFMRATHDVWNPF